MHIIRTGSMRRLKLCALFVVSMYISRVNGENVRKISKMYISRVNGENVRKISKNGYLKIKIYESNDMSSCRA